ncbi:MAG: hypothetical protein ACRETN_05765 [Nevskiales bacterium]
MRLRETRGVCRCHDPQCSRGTRLFAIELFADGDTDISTLEEIVAAVIANAMQNRKSLTLIGEPSAATLAKVKAAANN